MTKINQIKPTNLLLIGMILGNTALALQFYGVYNIVVPALLSLSFTATALGAWKIH